MNDIWKAEELEELVLGEIAKLKAEDIEPPKPKKGINNSAELKKIDSQISRLMDLYAVKGISFDAISKKVADLEAKKAKLATPPADPQKGYLVKDFAEAIENGNADQIRAIVRSLISKVEIDGEDVTIWWNF